MDFKRLTPAAKVKFFVGAAFVLCYLVLGIILLAAPNLIPLALSPALRIGFGALLVVYAVFRTVRLFKEANV